jgi:hypothetical protein
VSFQRTHVDPVLAAIKTYEKCYELEAAAYTKRSDAQEVFRDTYGAFYPDGLCKEAQEELAAKIDPKFATASLARCGNGPCSERAMVWLSSER